MRAGSILWLIPLSTSGFSSLSSFTAAGRRPRPRSWCGGSSGSTQRLGAAGISMYGGSHDPPSSPSFNAWSVLAKTEKWISDTLSATNDSFKKAQEQQQSPFQGSASSLSPASPPAGGGGGGGNPYTRKEVEYACENAQDSSMITASVFRRLKEVREMGERHGVNQEKFAQGLGSAYEPRTFRKTQVVVIPGNEVLMNNFTVFDRWMETINQARRNARDYVTDLALEKLDSYDAGDPAEVDWSVSVNCAHLHPKFGELTPRQQLQKMKEDDLAGEIDVNYEEFRERRMLARRSPYPTLVLEVRAVPPPDFGQSPPPSMRQSMPAESRRGNDGGGDSITSADIQRLEALFGKSPAFNHPAADRTTRQQEEDFFNQIGKSIQEVSSVTPLRLAQEWFAQNDPDIPSTAVFTESDTQHVDAAYEFVYTNLAMMRDSGTPRQYLVMPRFLSASATSFEKLSHEVSKLVSVLPDLAGRVKIHTFHPEHVDSAKRSPVPVYVLEWKENINTE